MRPDLSLWPMMPVVAPLKLVVLVDAMGVEREDEGPEVMGGVGRLAEAEADEVGGPRMLVAVAGVPAAGPRIVVGAAAGRPPRAPAGPPPRGPRPLPRAPDILRRIDERVEEVAID